MTCSSPSAVRPPEMCAQGKQEAPRGRWNVRALLEATSTPFAVVQFAPRAAIYVQGSPCDSVMYIEQGRVWLAVTDRRGKEAICGVLSEGAFLGEDSLIGRTERRQSAKAMTAVELLVVATPDINRLLRSDSAIIERFVAHLLARNARLEADLTDQLLYCSERRLAHTLLLLANCDLRHPRRCAFPRVPQEILAEMVGTTRSRVNAFMGRFRRVGFIEEVGGAILVNPARLDAVPERDQSST